ncbi:hypothetical protein M9H77_02414 [Catharanthus roseus]|uniref:Uncharacterized protein n=1 Tax=Catharanthus roseus TaxID=4058 RepID=A0ACC0C8B4_CATRO|nr:hypothetical protein M9H77_02414 [Catharanthus roseus]
MQSQFFNFLTTTCGTGMKAKGEGMVKELSIGFEDTSIRLSLNLLLLCHELSFHKLNIFLELYASYVTLIRNLIVNPLTCELALDVDHMLKFSSSCAYLQKHLLDSVARIKVLP